MRRNEQKTDPDLQTCKQGAGSHAPSGKALPTAIVNARDLAVGLTWIDWSFS
ncbi:hypothetical protein RR42_m3816 [Cupriavidus basilensis]|uniref:Uncharacterized protein n=1 Tax=Cupriavidus basilensis TaxID=68895 RepID=A0A0C4YKN9_9BURK|nr:hypothetical protein RR42_m3816 [Cupriavidus basilensis]